MFGSTPDLLSGLDGGVVDQLVQFWHSQMPFSMELRSSGERPGLLRGPLVSMGGWTDGHSVCQVGGEVKRAPASQTLRVSENP